VRRISTIFFDIGGVCLTNGWDRISREKASIKFSLDYREMEKRHTPVFKKFDKGVLSLDEYLNQVVFFRKRDFSREEFAEFMYSESRPILPTLKILRILKSDAKYHIAAINNESTELNKYRIHKFRLYKYFNCFFSSCYLGVRKPEPEIFYRTLMITHKKPGECLFIDDREENILSAQSLGLNTVLLDEPSKLKQKLKEFKIEI
jgi:putative hydrolase of the HAD superfamily